MPWISFPFYSHGLHSLWQKEPQYFCTVTFLPSLSSLWCLCSPCYTQIPILNGICYVPKRSNTIRCPHQFSPLMGVSNSWDDTLDIICNCFWGLLCFKSPLVIFLHASAVECFLQYFQCSPIFSFGQVYWKAGSFDSCAASSAWRGSVFLKQRLFSVYQAGHFEWTIGLVWLIDAVAAVMNSWNMHMVD